MGLATEGSWGWAFSLGDGGPMLELPAGWSLATSETQMGMVWCCSPAEPDFQLGCIMAGPELTPDERIAGSVARMTDGRVVARDDGTSSSWTVLYHWVNAGTSSTLVEKFVRGARSVILCASVPSARYAQSLPVIDRFLTSSTRQIEAFSAGVPGAEALPPVSGRTA